ncbi:MAG: PD40 domain-containing protein [Ignavibacteria bacterium]|nr:PD40 domain-containing protein [Ignavibacteria bacterium]
MKFLRYACLTLISLFFFSQAYAGKITYCSSNGTNGYLQVFSMNEDGSGKKQLTNLDENCMKPKWSPDGKQIVFYTDKGMVYLIRNVDKAPGDEPYYLWNGYYPSFMPSGDEVIFNNEVDDVLSILVIDTLAGAEPQQLSDGSYSNMQALTPDGSRLVYSTFIDNVKTVVMIDLTDTVSFEPQIVSLNREANIEPDISADGKLITYSSFDDNLKGTVRIFKDGQETALTKGMPSSNVPRFSPDGKQIAFVVISESSVSLYAMDSEGNGKKEIRLSGGSVGTFEWMDSERIIYDAGTETRLSVGIVDVSDGSSELIAEGSFNLHPSYTKAN